MQVKIDKQVKPNVGESIGDTTPVEHGMVDQNAVNSIKVASTLEELLDTPVCNDTAQDDLDLNESQPYEEPTHRAIARSTEGSPIKAVVVCGFPGVGKTYLTSNMEGVWDSDSSNFPKDDFPYNYIAHIQEARNRCKVLLVSSHKEVRDALHKAGIEFTLVYPYASCYSEYVTNRNGHKPFIEILKANYYDWVRSCIEDKTETHIMLGRSDYLSDVIDNIV